MGYSWSGKRTLEHCGLITKMQENPRQLNGKCEGFQKSTFDDEPCEICKKCKLHIYYEN
jgi:hypothetical protein